jgi:hypothetical protein
MKSPFSSNAASGQIFTADSIRDLAAKSSEFRSTMMRKGSGPAGGGASGPGAQVYAPLYHDLLYNDIAQYQTPKAKNAHNRLMRQIYNFDGIAGPAIDLYAEITWSDFDLSGVEDRSILHIYEDALNNLQLPSYLPKFTANWLVIGRLCVHFLFDGTKGIWTDLILHDDDDIQVTPVPLLNEDPLVDLVPSVSLRKFVIENDARAQQYISKLPPNLIEKIKQGQKIPLDNSNTIYLPRKMMSNDFLGTSMYSRIIGLLTLERALFNASVSRAQRAAGTIRVLKMGNEKWLPSEEEVNGAVSAIMMAEEDPTSSVIAFKSKDIDISAIAGSASENLWKISDEADYIQNAKFRALGMNEAMMSGDATYNNMEQALSVFLERIRSHRALFEQKIIIERVLEPLARVHGFKKTPKKSDRDVHLGNKVFVRDQGSAGLILPTIQWHKPLEPRMDQTLIDLLTKAEEVGFPVPLRKWATAVGVNVSELESQSKEDIQLREKFAKVVKKINKIKEETGISDGGGDFEDHSDEWGGSGGGSDKGPDAPAGGGEDGPKMEPVEPSDDSVVDKIPPPPGGDKQQEPSSFHRRKSLKNHPLLVKNHFGTISVSRLKALMSLEDKDRLTLIRTWTESDRAFAKYALSYNGSSLKLTKSECKIVASALAKHRGNPRAELESVQLHFASEVPMDILTGYSD